MRLYQWAVGTLLGASVITAAVACATDNSRTSSRQAPYRDEISTVTPSPINYGVLKIDGKEYGIDPEDGRNVLHEEIISSHFSDPVKVDKEYLVLFLKRERAGDYAMTILIKRDGIFRMRRFLSLRDPFFKSDPPFSTRVDFPDYNNDGTRDIAIQSKTWFEQYRESLRTIILDGQSLSMLLNQVTTGKDLQFKDY